jgi:hypothetical protein
MILLLLSSLVLSAPPTSIADPLIPSRQARVNASGSMQIECTSGCSGSSGGASRVTADIGDGGILQQQLALVCLEATQTNGTAKAIARGGAKGATAAADLTSTAIDANHQGLDVMIGNTSVSVTGTFWQATQPVSGTVTANQGGAPWSQNVTQIGGSAIATAATGVQKVGFVGSAGAAIDAANNAAVPANVIATGIETVAVGSTPTAATAGNIRRQIGDLSGTTYVVGPSRWTCNLNGLAASLTQCQAAPAAGFAIYVTSVIARTTTGTAGTFAIRAGTGSNCATGPTGVWPDPGKASPASVVTAPISTVAPFVWNFPDGLKLTAANALCVIGVATNTIDISISGNIGP